MTPETAHAIWAVGAVTWCALRVPFERKAAAAPIAVSRRSMVEGAGLAAAMIGLGIVPAIHLAFGFAPYANYPFLPAVGWAGAALFAGSLALFVATHWALGANWSISLDLRERHALVTRGVYARIRHPMYAAFWLWALAQAALIPNAVAGLAGLAGFGLLYAVRVGREERMMLDAFGEDYRAYMARTARILPGVH
jgi:protein-S-isoprenylcysteine O-methyltransferase Ste14